MISHFQINKPFNEEIYLLAVNVDKPAGLMHAYIVIVCHHRYIYGPLWVGDLCLI